MKRKRKMVREEERVSICEREREMGRRQSKRKRRVKREKTHKQKD